MSRRRTSPREKPAGLRQSHEGTVGAMHSRIIKMTATTMTTMVVMVVLLTSMIMCPTAHGRSDANLHDPVEAHDEENAKGFENPTSSDNMPYQPAVWRADGDYGCPYVIETEEEALVRIADESLPGNTVTIDHLRFCRTGNHFSIVYRNLALGYCCKSRVLTLPPKDDILAPGIFNTGTPGPRWFDFSNAPDVEGFNSSSCTVDIGWAGPRAFHMNHLEDPLHEAFNPELLQCIKRVPRMLGCESQYFFPKDVDVCPPKHATNRAGNLVIHIRSGDIFGQATLSYYGQPPLQFYSKVIEHRDWDRIDVLTSYWNETVQNPVIPALQRRLEEGAIAADRMFIHTDRSIDEDFRTMMCADALAIARSTMNLVTSYHTKASTIFGPQDCTHSMGELATLRSSDLEVYGLDWKGHYSVYKNWENTAYQREEMINYSDISGLTKCDADRHDVENRHLT